MPWPDCCDGGGVCIQSPIALSQNPSGNTEHPVGSAECPATSITGKLTYTQGPRQRNLDITLEYRAVADTREGPMQFNMYEL